MARIRTIKPDYYTSLTTADLSLLAFALFPGLLTHVDDSGRCVYDPRLLKAALAPVRDEVTSADLDVCVNEWEAAGMVVRYRVDGREYLEVTGFAEHQRVNRPSPSKYPSPASADPPCEPSRTAHAHLSEDSPQERKGKEGNREGNRELSSSGPADDPGTALPATSSPEEDDDWPVEVVDTARTVARLIADNGHPLPTKGTKAARAWLVEMDRLLRLGPPGQTTSGPPTPDDVIAVATWACNDQFWAANVQSIPKLREKWSQLAIKARAGPTTSQSPTGLDAVLAAASRSA